MMTDKKDLRKNLNICLLLTLPGGLAIERSIVCRAGCACAAAAILR